MAASRKCAEMNPPPSAPTDIEAAKISKRLNWYMFYTGGLLTTGGLGWGLRLAYAEEPKAAMLSYLTGSAGLCLFNMAVLPRPGKKASKTSGPNWLMMIPGALLSGAGFGYCLTFALKENPKSAIVAYTVGSLGYIMANAALYSMYREKEKKKRMEQEALDNLYRKLYPSNTELLDAMYPPHARVDFPSISCEACKAYAKKAILKRKESEKRRGLRAIGHCLWNSIKKIFTLTGRAKDQDSLVGKTTSSQGNLKRETSKTCRDEHNTKEPSNRKPSLTRPVNLSEDPAIVFVPRHVYSMPRFVPNKVPGEKSTQTESQLGIHTPQGTQTEESFLVRSNRTPLEDPTTKEGRLENRDCALADEHVWPSDLPNKSLQMLELSTEDQQLELEDKQ